MGEQIRNFVGNKDNRFWVEMLKILLIPALTWLFIYYGAFVKLETRFDMFCASYGEFKEDVKNHMKDKDIHFLRSK